MYQHIEKKPSCETTLLALTENWKQALDSNQYIIGLLSTHISDDQQNRVKFNGITGSWKDVIRGCPQGSSFGSLVWSIFQNVTLHMISGTKVTTP